MPLFVNHDVYVKIKKSIVLCKVIHIEYDRIFLALPLNKMNALAFLDEGSEVELTIESNEDGLIKTNALVLSVTPHGIFEIDYSDEDSSRDVTQRREYLRMNDELTVELFIDNNIVTCKTVDVSGSSIKLISHTKINNVKNIYARLIIENDVVSHIYGEIFKNEACKENEYIYHYTKIKERELTKIIKHVNYLSGKSRKKFK